MRVLRRGVRRGGELFTGCRKLLAGAMKACIPDETASPLLRGSYFDNEVLRTKLSELWIKVKLHE